ncbi:MAG: hypothetical protein AB9846_03090 [Tenuifilaceae bacterium]
MKAYQFAYSLAICFLVFSISTKAETISGEVKGKVIDSQNKPIEFETQRLNISFNYRFGKSEVKTRANRSTASSEEQGRSSK